MIASERRKRIINALSGDGIISLKEIAKQLDVAEITIRRDFEKLEKEGKLTRVQGGATIEDFDSAELTMKHKMPIHMSEKEKLAEYANSLVKDGDCVFIDAGTTALPLVARILKKNVHIITYNTLLLQQFNRESKAKLIMLGGEYVPHYSMNIGPIAQESLRQFRFDIAFFGCSGIDIESGQVFTTETESLLMKRIAIENTTKNVLLADGSKLVSRGFFKIDSIDSFDEVVVTAFEGVKDLPESFVVL